MAKSWRDKSLGELFPRMADKWPRTFLVFLLWSVCGMASGALALSLWFFGPFGPLGMCLSALLWLFVAAVYGDLRARHDAGKQGR